MQTRAGNFSSDAIGALTSAGWDTVKPSLFNRNDSRVSTQWYSYFYFVDPRLDMIEGLNKLVQTASNSMKPLRMNMVGNKSGIDPYVKAAIFLLMGLGINAGHDLSLDNIPF
jgi:pyridoxine 5-phosphate synthase